MQYVIQEVLGIKEAVQHREAREDMFRERGGRGGQNQNEERRAQKLPQRTHRSHKGGQGENEPDGLNQRVHG